MVKSFRLCLDETYIIQITVIRVGLPIRATYGEFAPSTPSLYTISCKVFLIQKCKQHHEWKCETLSFFSEDKILKNRKKEKKWQKNEKKVNFLLSNALLNGLHKCPKMSRMSSSCQLFILCEFWYDSGMIWRTDKNSRTQNCETQPPASIGWVALSSVIVGWLVLLLLSWAQFIVV